MIKIAILIAILMGSSSAALADRISNGSGGGKTSGRGSGGKSSPMKTVDQLKGGQPIVGPFKEHFDKCAWKGANGSQFQGGGARCRFHDMGISRQLHRGKRPSCHNKDEAIDVGKVECGGRIITPENHPESYMEIAKCLATEADDKFKVIYLDKTPVENMMPGGVRGKHKDHMHVQLKTCKLSGKGKGKGKSSGRGRGRK